MSAATISISIVLEVIASAIRKKKKKDIYIGKEEITLSLFENNVILHSENPKVPSQTHRLLE